MLTAKVFFKLYQPTIMKNFSNIDRIYEDGKKLSEGHEYEIKIKVPFLPNNIAKHIPISFLNDEIMKGIGSCAPYTIKILNKISQIENKKEIESKMKSVLDNISDNDLIEYIEKRIEIDLSNKVKNYSLLLGSFIFSYITTKLFPINIASLICLTFSGLILYLPSSSTIYTDDNTIERYYENTRVEKYLIKIDEIKEDGYYLIFIYDKNNGHAIGVIINEGISYVYDCNSGLYKGNIKEIIERLNTSYYDSADEIKIMKLVFE